MAHDALKNACAELRVGAQNYPIVSPQAHSYLIGQNPSTISNSIKSVFTNDTDTTPAGD